MYRAYYVSSYPESCPQTYTTACLIDNLTPFKRFLVCKLTISLALENTHHGFRLATADPPLYHQFILVKHTQTMLCSQSIYIKLNFAKFHSYNIAVSI
jgi:hypothetical protein